MTIVMAQLFCHCLIQNYKVYESCFYRCLFFVFACFDKCKINVPIKRLTKKALLLLRLTEKYSFTLSKLHFFGLRKPKNSSFYPTSLQMWVTHFTFGSPTYCQSLNLLVTILIGILYLLSLPSSAFPSKPPRKRMLPMFMS